MCAVNDFVEAGPSRTSSPGDGHSDPLTDAAVMADAMADALANRLAGYTRGHENKMPFGETPNHSIENICKKRVPTHSMQAFSTRGIVCVCVLHIKPFFYSSTSSTPSVRTDSSP